MKRLLWKEFRSSFWILLLTCIGVTILGFTGDPLFFRGESPTVYLMIPFGLMGLRAYSTELASDTPRFLYSRPIRWWQILLAKLICALSCIVLTLLVAATVYAVMISDQYRPFLIAELNEGIRTELFQLMFIFAAGYVVSVLLPGTALSFAALVVWALVVTSPMLLSSAIMQNYRHAMSVCTMSTLFGATATLIAALVVARKLPSLSARERLMIWIRFPIMALLVGGLVGFINVSIHPIRPSVQMQTISPKGDWIQYIERQSRSRNISLILKSVKDERKMRIPLGGEYDLGEYHPIAWSPDSSRLVLIMRKSMLYVITPGSKTIKTMLKNSDVDQQYATIKWNAHSDQIAVLRASYRPGHRSYNIAVVDAKTGNVRYIDDPVKTTLADAMFRPETDPVVLENEGSRLFWPRGLHRSP